MADKRKLQAEIDRCLKKITEGVETFEDIWQKVHNAANANQKEKYEADLKKEIKKLQRLRDQIKTWIASNDIKDKQVLVEKRKLIETQMERFKVVERETKTKAYSKEGLGLAAKIDPVTREKEEFRNWLTDAIDRLNVQVDHFESDLEALNSVPKKRKADKDKTERVEDLNGFISRHKHHVKQLELILRMLDNSTISPADMKNLQEDMEYYIENSTDPDFEENLYMYDDLELDDTGIETINNLATSPADFDDEFTYKENSVMVNSVQPSSPTTLTNHSSKNSVASPRKNSKGTPGPITVNSVGNGTSGTKTSSTKINSSNGGNGSRVPTTPPAKIVNSSPIINSDHSLPSSESKSSVAMPPPVSGYAGVVGGNNHSQASPVSVAQSEVTGKSVTPSKRQPSVSIPHNNTEQSDSGNNSTNINNLITSISSLSVTSSTSSVTTMVNSLPQTTVPATSQPPLHPLSMNINSTIADSTVMSSPVQQTSTSSIISNAFPVSALSLSSTSTTSSSGASSSLLGKTNVSDTLVESSPASHGPLVISAQTHNEEVSNSNTFTTLKTMAAQAVATAGVQNNPEAPKQFSNLQNRVLFESAVSNGNETKCEPETRTAHLQPLLGVAPLGPVPLSKEKHYQLALVEPAFLHLPFPSDSERVRPYLPRNPYPTAVHHHHQIPPHLDSIEFFQRLSTETLFFIFYYQEGTRAQYLAAKALKKQSWRFHTKYMMWFQRHEEPKAITDEYEQGTYIYFDYEKWTQRKKDGFTFEYRYLEDKDLP